MLLPLMFVHKKWLVYNDRVFLYVWEKEKMICLWFIYTLIYVYTHIFQFYLCLDILSSNKIGSPAWNLCTSYCIAYYHID